MTATVHTVTGTAMYPKLFEFNRDMHEGFYGDCDGAYTIDLLMDKENLDTFTKSGSRVKPRITDEGLVIKFKRKHRHGMVPALGGAPKVVDKDEQPWPESTYIGNGSKVEVWYEVYETKMGKGTRLMAVKVLDLEEYEGASEDGVDNRLPF